jgi:hypothetical protein
MQKILTTFLCCFFLLQSFGQTQRKISSYLSVQYNKTIYDRTFGNNPWSVGLGLQTFLNGKTKFKPTIDFTANGSLEDDKVLRLTSDNKPVKDARSVINLFAGSSFLATQNFYLSFVLGPSFINSNTYLGIKPSIGFYFSKKQSVTAQISYINIFNRELNYQGTKKENFGSVSFAIVIKLF